MKAILLIICTWKGVNKTHIYSTATFVTKADEPNWGVKFHTKCSLFMQSIAKSGGDHLCFWIKFRILMFSLYWTLDKPNSFPSRKQFLSVFESQLKMLQRVPWIPFLLMLPNGHKGTSKTHCWRTHYPGKKSALFRSSDMYVQHHYSIDTDYTYFAWYSAQSALCKTIFLCSLYSNVLSSISCLYDITFI